MKIHYAIYKITNPEDGRVYYGSTKNPRKRFINHQKCARFNRGLCASKDFNYEEMNFEIVEDLFTDDKNEVLWCERKWIENNECVNIRRPILTQKERNKIINKARDKWGKKEWKCCCGKTILKMNKPQHFRTKHHQEFLEKYNLTQN